MTSDTDTDCCSREPQPAPKRSSVHCPSCGMKGRSVKPITVESLVNAAARTGGADGFRFCAEPGCDVAYFHPDSGERIRQSEVRVAIGQKQTAPERTLCYCFHHTAAEIEAQVAATGTSRIPDEIGAKCKQGLDRCEETNPQGSCCLGNVREVLRNAQGRAGAAAPESVSTEMAPRNRNVGLWATGGAVVSAVLSSACCWLPLLLIAFGASAAGVAGFFEAYRVYLLAATTVFLAAGFYLVYFRKERCEPGQACALPNPKLVRFNKFMLWVASAVVAAFALFPNYVGAFIGGRDDSGSLSVSSAGERLFEIEGMTCEACAQTLRAEISALPGVLRAEVSYESKSARVFVEPGEAPSDGEIEGVIEEAGYRGVASTPARAHSVSIRIDGMTCAGCAGGVQGSLASLPGVVEARVDYEKKLATVQLLPGGDTDALLAAVTAQGFEGHLEPRESKEQ